ncbi:Flagellar L-ring protein FlgH [hydrothermal vent metagenome]|uniref:Flagellar L-ring protein FlgH n=1 Tax=hydrothermal vent metagenome TaxID=652676 RepID=A0A3B0Y1H8_9ZZZZ
MIKLVGNLMKKLLAPAALLTLGACASTPPPRAHDSYRPTLPRAYISEESSNGSIYQSARDVRLFEDAKARHVGDIITVVLQESTSASKSAKTSTDKTQETEIGSPIVFGASPTFNVPGIIPLSSNRNNTLAAELSSSNAFEGEGDSSQSNSLTGNITVTIADVLPNGNLVIRGEKWLTLNKGEEFIQISGIVRPQDVSTQNTVLSTQIADARITYSGKGFLADANEMGWMAKFFNSAVWPF